MTMGILIFMILYTALTVHFWGQAWILVGLIAGTRAHLGELGRINWDNSRAEMCIPTRASNLATSSAALNNLRFGRGGGPRKWSPRG